jgi:hypothetical protein
MGMIYQWAVGAHCPIEAQIAGEELERIRTWNNGRLDAVNVVEASRDPGAPLHPAFEWNDKKAATAHRISQAMYVIRHVVVNVDKPDGESAPIRAFVSVQRDEDRSYTSIGHALSDDDLRAQVLASAWAELEAWRRRHAELIELAKVFAVIDKARPA